MGFYLNTKGNLKEDANGRQPDENYAREVMQLFTIGLHELNADGTLRLDANNQPDRDLRPERHHEPGARVHGLRLGLPVERRHVHQRGLARLRRAQHALRHEPDDVPRQQSFDAGGDASSARPFRRTRAGPEALRIALDTLFNHANTGPFFARQMIQRLVTSNPSPAYVGRVAAAFANNGAGVRGDLKAVWTAILTDTEARTLPAAAEHVVRQVARAGRALRAVGAHRRHQLHDNGDCEIYDLSGSDTALGQSPLRSPSVFNFFRPGYVPPNTADRHRHANRRRNSSSSTRRPPRDISTSCRTRRATATST